MVGQDNISQDRDRVIPTQNSPVQEPGSPSLSRRQALKRIALLVAGGAALAWQQAISQGQRSGNHETELPIDDFSSHRRFWNHIIPGGALPVELTPPFSRYVRYALREYTRPRYGTVSEAARPSFFIDEGWLEILKAKRLVSNHIDKLLSLASIMVPPMEQRDGVSTEILFMTFYNDISHLQGITARPPSHRVQQSDVETPAAPLENIFQGSNVSVRTTGSGYELSVRDEPIMVIANDQDLQQQLAIALSRFNGKELGYMRMRANIPHRNGQINDISLSTEGYGLDRSLIATVSSNMTSEEGDFFVVNWTLEEREQGLHYSVSIAPGGDAETQATLTSLRIGKKQFT